MGLLNIAHKDMVESIAEFQVGLLKNPYYLFNDKKANIVDYYNINKERSTLDESLRINYSNIDTDSPLRFNLINKFYLFGLERISLSLENGEFGLESSEIMGDALVLPKTITPYPGDYFTIDIVQKKYLFKVTDVTSDTFDDGGNYWKIQYKLDRLEDVDIKKLVVDEYEFSTGNIGTGYNCIIKKSKWDLAKKMDDISVQLKKFYKGLFYNDKVQTFTFVYMYQVCQTNLYSDFFYDPFLIEFLIQNNILANDGDKYTYIGHKTYLRPEFPIRYAKSIWRVLESKEMDNIDSCTIESSAVYISDPATIFQTRYENYFELSYAPLGPTIIPNIAPAIQILDPDVIQKIKENTLYSYDSNESKYNILIKYMNNLDLSIEDLIQYENIDEHSMSETYYFLIPIIIFCLESYIKKLVS